MMLRSHIRGNVAGVLGIGVLVIASSAVAGDPAPLVGLDDLIARIGEENVPTGAGVVVGHVEAQQGGPNCYPNQTLDDFDGKTFTEMSGSFGVSSHATNVALAFYGGVDGDGAAESIAPGIADIYLYEATHWVLYSYLKQEFPSFVEPVDPPPGLRIFNNSWAGAQLPDDSQDSLRRADWAIVNHDVVITCGVNNGNGTNFPLLSHVYNGIAVGVADGDHQSADTAGPYDGPGRMKPEIVAPAGATSYATPLVSGAAALMIETAQGLSPGIGESNAERSEVIKAVILAGAEHRFGWTNNADPSGPTRGFTDRPLDEVYGVDVLDVNSSHLIMTGGEHFGTPDPPGEAVNHAGWALPGIAAGGSRFFRMSLAEDAPEVKVLATWHRIVEKGFADGGWSVADVDLILWRIDEGESLVSLLGDPGVPYFAGGNVTSQSPVDNVEHLYIAGLAAGEYALEVKRQDALDVPWDVAVAWQFPEQPSENPADVNNDGTVDVADLVAVIIAWGDCPGCKEDITGDGQVDVTDLIEVILAWE